MIMHAEARSRGATESARRARRLLCALAVGAGILSCGGAKTSELSLPVQPPPPVTTQTWKQVWSEEFDGPAGALPDSLKWNHDIGDGCSAGICGWGNNEKEYYTRAPENGALNGLGQLAIVARKAAPGLTCFYGPCRYTSAKITTRGKMAAMPGRVEARIKLPAGQGLWPAFWMLGNNFPATPWPASGELDIMENHGSAPQSVSSAIHGPGYFGATPFAQGYVLGSGTFADDFHVFAVEWNAERVQFFVDDRQHYAIERTDVQRHGAWVFDKAFFVILNLAVGGNFDGDPKSDAILPATMLIDYVRAYTR